MHTHIHTHIHTHTHTPDPLDMEKDLKNAKAVVVDVGAPVALLEEFMALWDVDSYPFILVTSQVRTVEEESGGCVTAGRG